MVITEVTESKMTRAWLIKSQKFDLGFVDFLIKNNSSILVTSIYIFFYLNNIKHDITFAQVTFYTILFTSMLTAIVHWNVQMRENV